jgi:hypothetical protein
VTVIRGRLFMQAKLLRALAVRHGYRVVRAAGSDDRSCTAVLISRDTGEELGRVTFTMEDAKRAGLVRAQSAWQSHPARMLWARASKFVLDDFAPEVTLGLGSEDEIPEVTGETRAAPAAGEASPVTEPEEGEWWEPDYDPADGQQPDEGTLPAPAVAGPPATAGQLRKLQAAYRDHRVTDRQARLEFAATVVGRDITSSKELTGREVTQVMVALGSSEHSMRALLEQLQDPPEPEPDEPDDLAGPVQRTQIVQLLEQRHLTGTQRLDLLSELTNRPIHAIDHLTSDEAGFVIQMLTNEGQTVMPEQ